MISTPTRPWDEAAVVYWSVLHVALVVVVAVVVVVVAVVVVVVVVVV